MDRVTLILAAANDSLTLLDYISKAGVVAILIAILYGGSKKDPWWVFGREHRACLAREAEFKEIAWKSIRTAEASATVGEHLAGSNQGLADRNKVLREEAQHE